jgi:hypothetical protein
MSNPFASFANAAADSRIELKPKDVTITVGELLAFLQKLIAEDSATKDTPILIDGTYEVTSVIENGNHIAITM